MIRGIKYRGWPIWSILGIIMLSACSPTKFVPRDRYLLTDTKIEVFGDKKHIKKNDIEPFIRQRANTRFLNLFKFQLWLYNLSSTDTSQWISSWLRKIGENPSVYDPFVTEQTKQQISYFLQQQGYFNGRVKDSVKIRGQRIKLYLKVYTGNSRFIGHIQYVFEDPAIEKIVMADSANVLLKAGDRLRLDILQDERIRIETILRNNGYFSFTRDYINFQIDTFSDPVKANVKILISNFKQISTNNKVQMQRHLRYRIGNIQVWVDNQRSSDTLTYSIDSVMYDIVTIGNTSYFFRNAVAIRPTTLHNNILIHPNAFYRQSDVEETYKRLSALRLFKFINIGFVENRLDTLQNDSVQVIDCKIQLSLQKYQAYQAEFELTSRVGLGITGNINYQHRNLLKGGEVFSVKVNGSTETVKSTQSFQFKNTLDFGTELGLNVPSLLVPFISSRFEQRYYPRTNFTTSYNYLRRIQYTNQVLNGSYGFSWVNSSFTSIKINLADVNYVRILRLDSSFYRTITNTYLKKSFEDHLIIFSSINLLSSNQQGDKNIPFRYLRLGLEFAGNSTALLLRAFGAKPDYAGYYRLFQIRFAQYAKFDADFRQYLPMGENSKMVVRFFSGVAYPYGNSDNIPFEKQYFGGGANSMRGWQLRSLGPGSYTDTILVSFPDKSADLKLETNVELRFKMFWKLEGALFVDIGNIWSVSKDDSRSEAIFHFNSFISQLAVNSGVGLRFNFSFFILRIDMGLKLREPAQPKNPWIISSFRWGELLNPTIGIGYPF
ncbi:MAG: BamA/TamA family outer membrane protein [Bacteroidales bacterium]